MKFLLVDDHFLFREGLKSILTGQQSCQIVGTAETIAETITKVEEVKPDLILMNFNLPDGNGLEATQAILAKYPEVRIVFSTTNDQDECLLEAIRFGAIGYINKSASLNKFLAYIQSLKVDGDTSIENVYQR